MKACGLLKVNFLSSQARADPPEFKKNFVRQGTPPKNRQGLKKRTTKSKKTAAEVRLEKALICLVSFACASLKTNKSSIVANHLFKMRIFYLAENVI